MELQSYGTAPRFLRPTTPDDGGVSSVVAPKIAVEAGLTGNLGPIASFANLLALQMASKGGISWRGTALLQLVVGFLSLIPAPF